MNIKNSRSMNYHNVAVLALIVGVVGIAFQFMPGGELIAFMLSVSVLGGLIGGSNNYEEQDRQQLERSYKTAYEALLLILLAAYAFIELSRWLNIEGVANFLNGHWPGLLIAVMCVLMGIAGLQKKQK